MASGVERNQTNPRDAAEDRKKTDREENSLTNGDKVNREFELRLVGFPSVITESKQQSRELRVRGMWTVEASEDGPAAGPAEPPHRQTSADSSKDKLFIYLH